MIRGECYDRQFMFGKGAGSLPTASSILSDVMARLHGYRYEYKKMGFAGRPAFTEDVPLRVYVRYGATAGVRDLPWLAVREQYFSESGNYIIGDIRLADLHASRPLLSAQDVFLAHIPLFFTDRDN